MTGSHIRFALIVIAAFIAVDLYAFKGLRLITSRISNSVIRKGLHLIYWLVTAIMVIGALVASFELREQISPDSYKMFFYLLGFIMLVQIPKLLFVVFHGLDDILHFFLWLFKKLAGPKQAVTGSSGISRSKFLTQIGLIAAAVPFASIAYGILKGRFDFRVLKETLVFNNLPKAFDGVRIVHLSDFHIGSFFNNHSEVNRGIDMVNELNADFIFFTGDFVNNYADEIDGWEDVIMRLEAKKGKFAVLGNHDYGDYVNWESEEEKVKNLEKIKTQISSMGFKLLLNEWQKLEIDGEAIAVLGVDNWGSGRFPKYGDLNKATIGTEKMPFKLLLSHDPSHWDEEVLGKTDIDLTFSGHTHGMQFGVEAAGIKWSPVQWNYPRWAGLYTEGTQHLYVNRGFGYIGFPARVGIWPEITLIELKAGEGV